MTRYWVAYLVFVAFILTIAVYLAEVKAGTLDETRCCTVEIARTADGTILRRADTIRAFRKLHPCPVTGLTTGACPGWAIDHIIPLACNGFDSVTNMQWLPVQIKSAAGIYPKDRWERKINCSPMVLVN